MIVFISSNPFSLLIKVEAYLYKSPIEDDCFKINSLKGVNPLSLAIEPLVARLGLYGR